MIMMSSHGPYVVRIRDTRVFWSCGCETWRDGDTFFIIPCSENCQVFKTAMRLSRERGNKIETVYEAS